LMLLGRMKLARSCYSSVVRRGQRVLGLGTRGKFVFVVAQALLLDTGARTSIS
jgi:hypothetical protein